MGAAGSAEDKKKAFEMAKQASLRLRVPGGGSRL